MVNLAVQQISKSQRLAPKLYVEPDAKVMQDHFSGQAGLKAIQRMRTLASQPKGIEDLVIDRFNDLPQPSQPAAPGLGPTRFAALMRRANHLGSRLASSDAPARRQSPYRPHRRRERESRHWADAARTAGERQRRSRPSDGRCNCPQQNQSQ